MKKTIQRQTETETIIIKISTDGCGQKPYFSITGEIYHKGKPMTDRNMISCGCVHEDILKVAPELKPLVDIHLSDMDGVPMHAEANGWYWLAKAAGVTQKYEPDQAPDKCLEIFADHCRISKEESAEIIPCMSKIHLSGKSAEDTRIIWSNICENMKPRWKKEAEKALEMIAAI